MIDISQVIDVNRNLLLDNPEYWEKIKKDPHIRRIIAEGPHLHQIYGAAIKEIHTKLEILDEEFTIKHNHNPIHHFEYRLKSHRSIIEKLVRRNLEFSLDSLRKNITDIAGVRVICNYISDTQLIKEFLLKHNDIRLLQEKDYITNPKPNGYRSLHLIVETPVFLSDHIEMVPVEIQIRTIGMDFWASLEHQLKYKSSNNKVNEDVSEDIRKQLEDCAELVYELDLNMQSIFDNLKDREN